MLLETGNPKLNPQRYFPYSRQSKKKSHRGAITASLVANLLAVAGIHHVITVDLHAPPTQGFFGKPVDNLHAEPLIARWIRTHVKGWQEAVVVSKNPGGTKRVTSLADALKLSFGLVTTDRRRTTLFGSVENSLVLERPGDSADSSSHPLRNIDTSLPNGSSAEEPRGLRNPQRSPPQTNGVGPTSIPYRHVNSYRDIGSSPLAQSTRLDSASPPISRLHTQRDAATNSTARANNLETEDEEGEEGEEGEEDSTDEYTDERAREVITGRLIHGHIVDDDAPSPIISTMSNSIATLPGDPMAPLQLDERDPMTLSFMSGTSAFHPENGLGGSIHDATGHSDDEEEGFKNPELEHTITLVGNVRDKIVFIIDDLIDQCGSWVAAAETVIKRGDAKRVYCIATHGLFGDDSLEQMEACDCIDYIVVTNTYPIARERVRACKKLVILDISNLLSEAIRRNHYGESISALFQHYPD